MMLPEKGKYENFGQWPVAGAEYRLFLRW